MTKLTPEEEEKLPKEVLHEVYLFTVRTMLLDFFVASTNFFSNYSEEELTVKAVQDFIQDWVKERFLEEPIEGSNPDKTKLGESK